MSTNGGIEYSGTLLDSKGNPYHCELFCIGKDYIDNSPVHDDSDLYDMEIYIESESPSIKCSYSLSGSPCEFKIHHKLRIPKGCKYALWHDFEAFYKVFDNLYMKFFINNSLINLEFYGSEKK